MKNTSDTRGSIIPTNSYKEPAPITDKENPFESMMERFDHAAKILGLEQGIYNYLKNPVKQIITSIPIIMDHGGIEVFEGYRSEEHTSELQSLRHLVCRLLLEKKKKTSRQ